MVYYYSSKIEKFENFIAFTFKLRLFNILASWITDAGLYFTKKLNPPLALLITDLALLSLHISFFD